MVTADTEFHTDTESYKINSVVWKYCWGLRFRLNGDSIGFYLKTKNSQLNFFILMTSWVQELTKSLIYVWDKKEKSKSKTWKRYT